LQDEVKSQVEGKSKKTKKETKKSLAALKLWWD
jgi:hypothetical protein